MTSTSLEGVSSSITLLSYCKVLQAFALFPYISSHILAYHTQYTHNPDNSCAYSFIWL